jgi:hypothetical protein
VYGFPVIGVTRSMTVKAVVPVTFASVGAVYADFGDAIDGLALSDLLAYEIAKLKKETSQGFLDNILRAIPQSILSIAYGGAVRGMQLQAGITQVDY